MIYLTVILEYLMCISGSHFTIYPIGKLSVIIKADQFLVILLILLAMHAHPRKVTNVPCV